MNESKRNAIKFLEKEIKTYLALALFLSKMGFKANAHVRVGDSKVQLSPSFYKDRMKEATKLVAELRTQNLDVAGSAASHVAPVGTTVGVQPVQQRTNAAMCQRNT